MATVFAFYFLFSCIGLLIGLIAPSVALFWLGKEKRTRGRVFIGYSIAIIASFSMFVAVAPKPHAPAAHTEPSSTRSTYAEVNSSAVGGQSQELSMPESEMRFTTTIRQYAAVYEQGENELKKSKLWTDRNNALAQMGGAFDGWVGVIESMGTNTEGNAYVTISIGDSILLQTSPTTALGDDGTMIPQGSRMYNVLSNMKEGDRVIFSFELYRIINLTESGAMTEPVFLVRFNDIKPAR